MKPILLLALLGTTAAQAGTLLLPTPPADVRALLADDTQVNVGEVREVCRQLTDDDVVELGGFPVSKRPKGMKRHVKHLCEQVDLLIWENTAPLAADFDALYELRLLQASLYQKSRADAIGMTLRGKLTMGLYSILTPFTLSFRNDVSAAEATNLPLAKPLAAYTTDELAALDPADSPFFEDVTDKDPHKRFGDLAKKKKINVRDTMALVFDGVSTNGSAPKIKLVDSLNAEDEWSLKWGDEVHTDVVGSRLFAALGFDVDHPYYRTKDDVFVVFPQHLAEKDADAMLAQIRRTFKIDVTPFVSTTGIVGDAEIARTRELEAFRGLPYVTFKECAIEARPDRVKRLGSIAPTAVGNAGRRELRGALLAHMWLDNWDVREENTLLTVNHLGKFRYETRGAFSDLGTSLGVKLTLPRGDFRVGLPNQFGWNLVKRVSPTEISFHGVMNSRMAPYKAATYADLKWMASKLARVSGETLEKVLEKSGWPAPIQAIYFHKLAARRAQILDAFGIADPHPIAFTQDLTVSYKGEVVVREGRLLKDIDGDQHPIGFRNTRGRVRNYGRDL